MVKVAEISKPARSRIDVHSHVKGLGVVRYGLRFRIYTLTHTPVLGHQWTTN